MPEIAERPAFRWFDFLEYAAVRSGIYIGISLSLIFSVWLLLANRAPFLEPLALERNIIAAALLALLALIPLIRFFRSPCELLISGILAWSLLTLTYWIFGLKFVLLEEYYSAFHIFVLGAVSYLIFATVSWIGTIVWRVHATHSSHTHH
jgi:hypothetical protein